MLRLAMVERNMFITIGPQCCGKTSFLQAHKIMDINMDSIPGTYEPLSLDDLFQYSSAPGENQRYERDLHGLTVAERIEQLAQSECYALILFFHEVTVARFSISHSPRKYQEMSSISRSNTSVN